MTEVRSNKRGSISSKTSGKKRRNRIKKNYYFDYSLVAVLIFLLAFGLIMLYSISAYTAMQEGNSDMYYFQRQLIYTMLGLVAMVIASKIPYHFLGAYSGALYWISMVAMALVQTPLGIEANGARRWIYFPIIGQFQPSEITKLAIILYVPYMISIMGKAVTKKENYRHILLKGAMASAGVLFLTDNLSTAIIVFGIVMGIIVVALPQSRAVVVGGMGVLIAGYLAVRTWGVEILTELGGFRGERILVWLEPEKYASDGGYQVLQGLYAIGSGGLFGKGLGNGTQKITAIPEVQNDYILAAIIEELGIFGAAIILILFGLLLYRLFFIASNAPDIYGSLVVTGIFIHLALQVILNIAVVTALIPNTGITLPFISYGGTAMVFLLTEIGIALSVSSKIVLVAENDE
ncbi:MAG: putative peptidoglycan glycosyltransferase FtsW [Eubacteriales bacterium]